MTREAIPPEVRRFVLTSIPSVPFLEALLLLRSAPKPGWTLREVSRRLYLPEPGVRKLLAALADAGFAALAADGSYRYAPAPELAAKVDQLQHWYTVRLVDVTSLIHSGVDKRAQQFADAFRWKRED